MSKKREQLTLPLRAPRDTSRDLFPLNTPVRLGAYGEVGQYRGFVREDAYSAVHRVRLGERRYRYVTEASLTPLYRLADLGGLLRRFEPITRWDDIAEAVEYGWNGYA